MARNNIGGKSQCSNHRTPRCVGVRRELCPATVSYHWHDGVDDDFGDFPSELADRTDTIKGNMFWHKNMAGHMHLSLRSFCLKRKSYIVVQFEQQQPMQALWPLLGSRNKSL